MKRLSATDASRSFAHVLDSVERDGESFVVVRHGREVATIAPAVAASGKRVKDLLVEHRPDADWNEDLRILRGAVGAPTDPWTD